MMLIKLLIYLEEFFSLCGIVQAPDLQMSSADPEGQCCFVTLLCHYLVKVGDKIGHLRNVHFDGNIADGGIVSRGEQLSSFFLCYSSIL